MSSPPAHDPLDQVIERFLTAERALIDLGSSQERLHEAVTVVQATGTELRERSTKAEAALEDARARLREQMLTSGELAKDTGELQRSLPEAASEIAEVLQTLRGIDPAAMTQDLAEIRRDGTDNAAEVRELRRLVGDLQRDGTANATELKELTRSLSELQRIHGELAISQAQLAEEHSGKLTRLQILVPVSFTTLVTAVAAVVISLVR